MTDSDALFQHYNKTLNLKNYNSELSNFFLVSDTVQLQTACTLAVVLTLVVIKKHLERCQSNNSNGNIYD